MCQHCYKHGDTAVNEIDEMTAVMEPRFLAGQDWERIDN